VGLARLQRGTLGLGVVGGVQQPPHPRRIDGPRVDAVDADALADVVGRHGPRQREHGALAGRVQGALGQASGGDDRAGVDDGGLLGAAQVRQRSAGDAHDPQHIDLEHLAPLILGVVLDRSRRADARVVDEDVQAAQPVNRV
jgi:hypothetical protein